MPWMAFRWKSLPGSSLVSWDQTVLVKGSQIVEISASKELKIPCGALVIDGKGAYLMPGLASLTRTSGSFGERWQIAGRRRATYLILDEQQEIIVEALSELVQLSRSLGTKEKNVYSS